MTVVRALCYCWANCAMCQRNCFFMFNHTAKAWSATCHSLCKTKVPRRFYLQVRATLGLPRLVGTEWFLMTDCCSCTFIRHRIWCICFGIHVDLQVNNCLKRLQNYKRRHYDRLVTQRCWRPFHDYKERINVVRGACVVRISMISNPCMWHLSMVCRTPAVLWSHLHHMHWSALLDSATVAEQHYASTCMKLNSSTGIWILFSAIASAALHRLHRQGCLSQIACRSACEKGSVHDYVLGVAQMVFPATSTRVRGWQHCSQAAWSLC